ncbi:HotDog domain-containing protein [Fennellomyces sp. T-0311]|nr:HotDog domain-containing protein [Fennellomyces sp. T-0311]
MRINPSVGEKYPLLQEMVTNYAERNKTKIFWEDKVQGELTLVNAVPNKLTWEFEVKDKHCNMLKNIHGGCVATIIDICSSFAIMVYEGKHKWKFVGVSTELSVNYLAGMSPGQTARLECEVQRVGKSLGNIYTRVYNNEDDKLCYTSSHAKYRVDSRL